MGINVNESSPRSGKYLLLLVVLIVGGALLAINSLLFMPAGRVDTIVVALVGVAAFLVASYKLTIFVVSRKQG